MLIGAAKVERAAPAEVIDIGEGRRVAEPGDPEIELTLAERGQHQGGEVGLPFVIGLAGGIDQGDEVGGGFSTR